MFATVFVFFISTLAFSVAASIVISTTSGNFLGGLYGAFIGLLCSLMAYRSNWKSSQNSTRVGALGIYYFICLCIMIVANYMLSYECKFLDSLVTCYSSDGCHGACNQNSVYELYAAACYVSDPSTACICVTNDDNDDQTSCWDYSVMNSCSNFIDNAANQV